MKKRECCDNHNPSAVFNARLTYTINDTTKSLEPNGNYPLDFARFIGMDMDNKIIFAGDSLMLLVC